MMLALNYFIFILVGIIIGLVVAIIIKKTNMGVTNYENLWNKFRNIYGKNYIIAAISYDLKSIGKIGKHKTVYDLMIEMKKEKIIN